MKLEFNLRVSNTSNLREHFAVRAKRIKAERRRVWAELKKSKATPPGPFLVVRLTRIGPRQLDDDGVVSSLKGVRDQVAAWLGVDDRTPLVKWEYGQAQGEYGVRIEVDAPFVGSELARKLGNPIKFQWSPPVTNMGPPTEVNGYDVTMLIDVCKAVVAAWDAKALVSVFGEAAEV